MRSALPAMILLFVAILPVPALATGVSSDLTPDQEWRCLHLYQELKCPVCKTQSLASSTSFLAEEMKAQIRDFVREGRSDQEIIDYYVARYGDWILMRPPARGFSLLAWIVPVIAIMGAVFVVLFVLRRWSRRDTKAERDEGGAAQSAPPDRDERVRHLVDV